MGVLGRAVHARARVALRGRARLAACHDRPPRGHVQPRELRDDARVARERLAVVRRDVRHAAPHDPPRPARRVGQDVPRREGRRVSRGPLQERGMLRGVRMAWFTSLLLLDEDEAFAEIASGVPGLDAERLVRDLAGAAPSRTPTRRTAPRPGRQPGSATPRSRRTARRSSTAAPASPRRASSFATRAGRSSPAASSRSRPTTSASRTSHPTCPGARLLSRPSSSPRTRTA